MEQQVGSKLAEARAKKHWTLAQAAEKLGVSVNTVNSWEHGKVKPYAYNRERICEVYGLIPEELGLGTPQPCSSLALPEQESVKRLASSPERKAAQGLTTFMEQDLTVRLWSLASLPYQDVHSTMVRILKDYDNMTTEKNHRNSRREALLRLITLPFSAPILAAALTSEETPSAAVSKDILAMCAVSIAACWELRKSADYDDHVRAFEGVSVYLPVLQRIVKDSSEYRQEAASLATQCLLLKSYLSQHLEGMREATLYAQQALAYSEAANDISLHLKAFDRLVVGYFKSGLYLQALQTIQQAEALLKQKSSPIPLHLQARIHAQLAYTLTKNRQDGSAHLDQAFILHPGTDKECPMYVNYERTDLLRDAGTTYMLQGDSAKAVETFSQVVNPKTLILKMRWTELGRVETINAMTKAQLKTKDKDMEETIHFWTAGIEGAKALHSEERFNEALAAYEIMEYVWPGDPRIEELRDYIVHW